jgi:hypothetical protein
MPSSDSGDLYMAKKHMQGFAPIPFKLAGKVFLPVSIIMIAAGTLDYLFGWEVMPLAVIFFGIALLIISLYLIIFVPDN